MKKNAIISTLISFSVILSTLPTIAKGSEKTVEEVFLMPNLQEQAPYELIIDGEGAVSLDEIVNDVPATFSLSRLPAYYNAAEKGLVTSVKSQNPYGTCWAFSTTSAMETSMIKNGFADLDDVNYSELHLAYFSHTKNSFLGDGENVYNQTYGYFGGGSTIVAAQFLAGWQGMANEKDFPYPPSDKDHKISENARYTSEAHLQDYYVLNSSDVKNAIMEHGSVVVSFYDDNDFFSGTAYYRGIASNSTNHAVTIVGWDDEYALSNFDKLSKKPQNPGAWIVKNSWGKNWGDKGYFYLSYEEPSLANFVAFNAESADNYDIIHQYDGATNKLVLSATRYANIFTANDNQDLEAVGLYTSFPYSDYTIKIYKLRKNYSSPEDGTLLDTLSGSEQFVGFHTLELEEPLPLQAGDKFSVVCSLTNLSNQYYAPFEGSTAYNNLDNSSNRGESYIYSNGWHDAYNVSASNMKINNAAVKAYSAYDYVNVKFNDDNTTLFSTDVLISSLLDIPENPTKDGVYFAGWYKDKDLTSPWDFETDKITGKTILYAKWSDSPIPVESITLDYTTSKILKGEELEVNALVNPYYATEKDILWQSSDPSVASVNDGVISGINKGSTTISATASNGISNSFSLTVYNPMTSVQLGFRKPVFNTSEPIDLSIVAPEAESFIIHFMDSQHNHYYTRSIPNSVNIALSPLSADNYTMWVEATDYLGNKLESDAKTLRVTDELSLIAAKSANSYIAGGYNKNSEGELICAYYDSEDNFIGAVTKANSEYPTITFPKISGSKWVKIMWWDSTSGMSPITDSVIVSD